MTNDLEEPAKVKDHFVKKNLSRILQTQQTECSVWITKIDGNNQS